MKNLFLNKSKTIFIMCLSVIVFTFSGCGPRPKPENTVKEFVEHLNAYNANACIELLAPDIANQTKASMSLGGLLSNKLTGLDLDSNSLIALLPMLTGFLNMAGLGIDLPKWEAKNFNTTENGDKAEVTCDMFVHAGDSTDRYTASFELIYKNGKWLISDMQ